MSVFSMIHLFIKEVISQVQQTPNPLAQVPELFPPVSIKFVGHYKVGIISKIIYLHTSALALFRCVTSSIPHASNDNAGVILKLKYSNSKLED